MDSLRWDQQTTAEGLSPRSVLEQENLREVCRLQRLCVLTSGLTMFADFTSHADFTEPCGHFWQLFRARLSAEKCSGDVVLQRLDRLCFIARAKRVHEAPVLAVDLHQVRIAQVRLAEVRANAADDR